MYFGHNLKLLREKHLNINQEELSHIFKVTHATISAWESGKHNPKIPALLKIEEISGIPFRRFCLEKLQESDFVSKTETHLSSVVREPLEKYSNNNDRLDKMEAFLKDVFKNF